MATENTNIKEDFVQKVQSLDEVFVSWKSWQPARTHLCSGRFNDKKQLKCCWLQIQGINFPCILVFIILSFTSAGTISCFWGQNEKKCRLFWWGTAQLRGPIGESKKWSSCLKSVVPCIVFFKLFSHANANTDLKFWPRWHPLFWSPRHNRTATLTFQLVICPGQELKSWSQLSTLMSKYANTSSWPVKTCCTNYHHLISNNGGTFPQNFNWIAESVYAIKHRYLDQQRLGTNCSEIAATICLSVRRR